MVNDVITMEEVQALRNTLESGGEDNAPLYGIDMTTHHPSFLALARDTRITDIVAKLIGENIVLQHSKTVHKTPANPEGPRPGGGPVRFHQDFAYFPHTNYDVLAAMLVLDDFTEENVRRCFRRGSCPVPVLMGVRAADAGVHAHRQRFPQARAAGPQHDGGRQLQRRAVRARAVGGRRIAGQGHAARRRALHPPRAHLLPPGLLRCAAVYVGRCAAVALAVALFRYY